MCVRRDRTTLPGHMLSNVAVKGADSDIIRQCLSAAADGPFFPDWEFSTLFGVERDEIRRIAQQWPDWDDEIEQFDAVNATPNNLLGYSHGRWNSWHVYISAVSADVARVYARWRGENEIDPSGKGYFDRLT